MIVDGKIKIKNNTQIERYTKTGLKFTDGTELDADVVLYATGYIPSSSSFTVTSFMFIIPPINKRLMHRYRRSRNSKPRVGTI